MLGALLLVDGRMVRVESNGRSSDEINAYVEAEAKVGGENEAREDQKVGNKADIVPPVAYPPMVYPPVIYPNREPAAIVRPAPKAWFGGQQKFPGYRYGSDGSARYGAPSPEGQIFPSEDPSLFEGLFDTPPEQKTRLDREIQVEKTKMKVMKSAGEANMRDIKTLKKNELERLWRLRQTKGIRKDRMEKMEDIQEDRIEKLNQMQQDQRKRLREMQEIEEERLQELRQLKQLEKDRMERIDEDVVTPDMLPRIMMGQNKEPQPRQWRGFIPPAGAFEPPEDAIIRPNRIPSEGVFDTTDEYDQQALVDADLVGAPESGLLVPVVGATLAQAASAPLYHKFFPDRNNIFTNPAGGFKRRQVDDEIITREDEVDHEGED